MPRPQRPLFVTAMPRCSLLLTALLALAVAAPAEAQVRVRDHRTKKKKKREILEVERWSPQSGPVGTEVTLYGEGFGRTTTILFDGRRVRPTGIRSDRMSFRVPRRYGDGDIVVRKPRVRQVRVGTFHVESPPVVRRFAPRSGIPGTRVEIWGAAFEPDDDVLMNGRPIRVLKRSDRRLIVQVPAWAKTDHLVVRRADGSQDRTRARFRVTLPAPRLTGMQPSSGPPKTRVRLHGEHFSGRDHVFYGPNRVAVTRRGDQWIEVVVPERARQSNHFRIRGPGGEARSTQVFRLAEPPVLTDFSPRYGRPGDRVELHGENFEAGDRVRLDGRWLRIIQLRPGRITVEIPAGTRGGVFTIVRGDTRVRSKRRFELGYAPELLSFRPEAGSAGDEVTLRGRYLDAADVYYGRQRLRVLRRVGDHTLVVRVPRGAGDRRFRARTRYGETATTSPFQIRQYPTWRAVSPRRGGPGTRIRIRGDHLEKVDAVYLGGTKLPILSRHPRWMEVEVARGSRDGRLAWSSYGRRVETRWRFQVLTPPRVISAPDSAYPGAQIEIDGEGFGRRTRVYHGSDPLRVVRATDRRLTVKVPPRASGSEWLWVEDVSGRVRAPARLMILRPPELRAFEPRAGKPGGQVTLRGRGFSPTTEILFGKTQAPILRRSKDGTKLVVQVPPVRQGRQLIWLRDRSHRDRARRPFFVRGHAAIGRFSPRRTEAGETVEIYGRNLSASVRVYFGDHELRVVRAERSGKRLIAEVPEDIHGNDWLYVDDEGHRSRSEDKLHIKKRPKKVKVRDHRKGKGKRKGKGRRGRRGKRRY